MSDTDKVDSRLSNVYENAGDKRGVYDDWAATYDQDLIDDLGYVAHIETCRELISRVEDKNARILDAGCGTGLAGQYLSEAGYSNLHGNDYSEKMLEKARASGSYQTLAQQDLTQPVQTDEPYDAAISIGVFAFNTPAAEHMFNITCSLAIGGVALITVNGKAWTEARWEQQLENLEQYFVDVKLREIKKIDYLTKQGIDGRLLRLERIA